LADARERLSTDSAALRQLCANTRWVRRFSVASVLPDFVRQLERIVAEEGGAPDLVREQEATHL